VSQFLRKVARLTDLTNRIQGAAMTAAKITALAVFAASLSLWGLSAHADKRVELSDPSKFMQQECPKGWEWDQEKKKCVRQTRGSY
jgi:hypothetical protein